MPLESPNLDDRTFRDLVAEARQFVKRSDSLWTDLSPHDPGVVLLEVFAYLTELLLFRLNRIPEKAYVEFLKLMGVDRQPPAAASVNLRFSRPDAADESITIPEGTRVAAEQMGRDGQPIVFVTSQVRALEAGQSAVDVLAHHCGIASEVIGTGSGEADQRYRLRHAPVVAALPEGVDLVVGVEAGPDEELEGLEARVFQGASYRIWTRADDFAAPEPDSTIYMVDRVDGFIRFAPAVQRIVDGELEAVPATVAAVPAAGRRICAWYRYGGGGEGNVAAGSLQQLRDPLPGGVTVTNPQAAHGGRETESFENAVRRGPLEMHSLKRALTARDFEKVCMESSGGINRALAKTQVEVWAHGRPGTVELRLVPEVPAAARSGDLVTREQLEACSSAAEPEREHMLAQLEDKMALGTHVVADWVRYKRVTVKATVVAYRTEDLGALERRLLRKLRQRINPLRCEGIPPWRFGEALHVWHIHSFLSALPGSELAEPGVKTVQDVTLNVDVAPDRDVASICRSRHQPDTWFATSGSRIFRTQDDGAGWDLVCDRAGEVFVEILGHDDTPGLFVAAAIGAEQPDASVLLCTRDCGESFEVIHRPGWRVRDIAFGTIEGRTYLFVAGDRGLHRIYLEGGTTEPLIVKPNAPDMPLWAVTVSHDEEGRLNVAVAARESGGVFLSCTGGRSEQFRSIGLEGKDVRELTIGAHSGQFFLWAGTALSESGECGCHRWRLDGAEDTGWVDFLRGWSDAGSCSALVTRGEVVIAGTATGGVLRLDQSSADAIWLHPASNSGITRDESGYLRIDGLAWDEDEDLVLAGCQKGVIQSRDGGRVFASVSETSFRETVTLSPLTLFCSGEHALHVMHEDDPRLRGGR